MEDSAINDLKAWREKHGLSQKRLSELARISLTTLRHIEIGSHKPQKRTKRKLMSTLRNIESNPPDVRRLKPRKTVKIAQTRTSVPEPKSRVREPRERGTIKLTNLDLELISLILNMTRKEKLKLLQELI